MHEIKSDLRARKQERKHQGKNSGRPPNPAVVNPTYNGQRPAAFARTARISDACQARESTQSIEITVLENTITLREPDFTRARERATH
ncbi:MAG: hypothetical protein ABI905_09370 [Betaproteobacteria bacterium]